MADEHEEGILSADGQTRTFPRAEPMVAVLLEPVRRYILMARELGVTHLRVGDIEFTMHEVAPAAVTTPTERPAPRPRPLSPRTGEEMTDEEMIQYGEFS